MATCCKIISGSSSELRQKVMHDNAKGYSLAEWTNSQINNDDILISTHNSISLFNVRIISTLLHGYHLMKGSNNFC